MGLLSLGTPLPWHKVKQYADHVHHHGITQFLHIWERTKDRQGDELLWGDEVEYMVVVLDELQKNAKLSLRQAEILDELSALAHAHAHAHGNGTAPNGVEHDDGDDDDNNDDDAARDTSPHTRDNHDATAATATPLVPTFHPEYGRYMLESTPSAPYTGSIPDLLSVERNMRHRRCFVRRRLRPHEIPVTITSFPRLGVPGVFTEPYFDPADAVSSHSLFLPEEITNPHARFPTLTSNIRQRRGSKVCINLPLFFDKRTPRPFVDPTIPYKRSIFPEDSEAATGAALVDHIYLDAMGFGMGCCCLQITFQACNVREARRIYDALIPVGPILLALTAASPVWRGYLADVDCRWNVIAGSVDDRTEEERGLKPLKQSKFRIPKSRYDSVDLYISNDWIHRPEYNDIPIQYDESIYTRLRSNGLDDLLSKHIAHLFVRDPLVVFSETIDQDDTTSADHFENIQSTNWQTLRFKPPPPNSSIGWRVEFRSMEVQMTDFENAAFAVFVVLLSRAILSFHLNFYIPISKVDENMARAQRRDASRSGTFFFRRDVYLPGHTPASSSASTCSCDSASDASAARKERRLVNCFPALPPPPASYSPVENGNAAKTTRMTARHAVPVHEEYEEMSMDEIMNGKGEAFPGLLNLVYMYLDTLDVSVEERARIDQYLDLVKARSNGTLLTPATWIRNFVRSHPAYKFDSVVGQEINYDLMVAVDEIERGSRKEPTLLPDHYVGSNKDSGSYV